MGGGGEKGVSNKDLTCQRRGKGWGGEKKKKEGRGISEKSFDINPEKSIYN